MKNMSFGSKDYEMDSQKVFKRNNIDQILGYR